MKQANDLFYAISADDIEMVKCLLDNGIDVKVKPSLGGSPLWFVQNTEIGVEIASLLINAGADITIKDDFNGTALHRYSAFCNFELMSLAIKNGADVNMRNSAGITPFLALCAHREPGVESAKIKRAIELLINNRANIYENDITNKSAVDLAYCNDNFDVITELLSYDVDQAIDDSPLLFSMINNIPYFKEYVNAGADINQTTSCGENILFGAIDGNKISLTRFLIKKGIDINHQNNVGQTPAMYAAIMHHKKQFLALLEAGADLFIEDKRGKSAMDYLTDTNFKHDIEKILLEKEMDDQDDSVSFGL